MGKQQVVFRLPATVDQPTNNLYCDSLKAWESFEDFKKKSFSYFDITFPSPLTKQNWLEGKCDCGTFFKEFICEHVVAIACRLKLTDVRIEAKVSDDIPISGKRPRGRPPKAKAALVYQD